MLTVIISILKIIILLGFLIFIHELGHFTVAKLCNVKVNEFAIGFGPTIYKKQGKETKYALRLVPLGGFISMEGEEERSEDSRSFSKVSIPKRIAIVLAGPIVNIVFATVVFFILTSTSGTYISNEVKEVVPGFSAESLGIQNGDKIIVLDGKNINSKNDLNSILEKNKGDDIKIKFERSGEILEYNIKPTEVKTKYTGIYLDDKCKIVTLDKNSPAEKQGIQANDKIIKIDNEQIQNDTQKALDMIKNNEKDTIVFTIERNKKKIEIELKPEYISNYYLGISFKPAPDNFINRCINGTMETSQFLFSILDNLKQLFTGNVGVDQMMGPVGIAETVAKTDGVKEFIQMMALISLSLGITNLLPVPALDGGKILILFIEAIRRKPLNEKTEINIQLIGFSLLIILSLYVTYNDVLRIF